MMFIRFTTVLVSCLVACAKIQAANYFWVGNGGDWSDLSHWASISGGTGNSFGSLPSNSDDVVFDANSFTTPGEQITLDQSATVLSLDFTGVAQSPTFVGASNITLEVYGDITFVVGMTNDFVGTVDFKGTGTHSITSAGQILADQVNFSGTGTSTVQDAFSCTGSIKLKGGTLITNNQVITANDLDANPGSDNVRELQLGSSIVTLSGGGTVLDLQGNTGNLTLTESGAIINFTSTASFILECGSSPKTLPDFSFLNTTKTVTIRTGSAVNKTDRIVFGDITLHADGGNLKIDPNSVSCNLKTFGNITLPNSCDFDIGSPHGSSFTAANRTLIAGDLTVGNDCDGLFKGRFITFQGAVNFGTGADCDFRHHTQFDDELNVAGTTGNRLIMNERSIFNGLINVTGDSEIRIERLTQIKGGLNVADDVSFSFDHISSNKAVVTVSNTNNWILGKRAIFTLGNNIDGDYTFSNTITMQSEAQLIVNANTGTVNFKNITLVEHNVIQLSPSTDNIISGTLTANGDCSKWFTLKSASVGVQSSLNLTNAQNTQGLAIKDINVTGSTLTNAGGVDLANNTGNINFASTVTGTTLTWMGGNTSATGANKNAGTFTTGNNNDWSNPVNWTSTGSFDGNNQCIPSPVDVVIFNANSFNDGGAYHVNLDLLEASVQDMTFTGVPTNVNLDANEAGTDRVLHVYGSLEMHANVSNQYDGLIRFTSQTASSKTITSNTSEFYGALEFDFPGSDWTLQDDLKIDNKQNGDITITNGTLNATDKMISLSDDWRVGASGTFNAGTSSVVFIGPSSNTGTQAVTVTGTGDFYNLTVSREANGGQNSKQVALATSITVQNNLRVAKGALSDKGFQIVGNNTGTMSVAANARMILGDGTAGTTFPSGFTSSNISLNRKSKVFYNCNCTQAISDLPIYGSLYLSNRVSNLAKKTATGPLVIDKDIIVYSNNDLDDGGFQITNKVGRSPSITVQGDAKLSLGNNTTATVFPTGFGTISLLDNSTVEYQAGVAQSLEGISGTGTESYYHLNISNAAASGNATKTLTTNVIVRGDINIDANSTLDVSNGDNYSIELQGNWTNSGSFNYRTGAVTLAGSSTQTINANNNTQEFYDVVLNNAAGVTLEDDISLVSSLTFTDGIISPSSTEVVEFQEGSSVAGAPSNSTHVNGKVRKIGSTTFQFPVGKGGRWMPAALRYLSGVETFETEYFNTRHPNSTVIKAGDPLDYASYLEYWTIDRAGTVSADVRLFWKSKDSSKITDPSILVVAHYNSANEWESYGNDAFLDADNGYVEAQNVTDFSPFTFGSHISDGSNPLPIELVDFYVEQEEEIKLKWLVANQKNNAFFEIERSVNGKKWSSIGKIKGEGTTQEMIQYEMKDNAVTAAQVYYRLKQTDYDGTHTYSSIVSIENQNDKLQVYPTLVTNQEEVTIQGDINSTILDVLLYDAQGRIVDIQQVMVSNGRVDYHMPISSELPKGNYLLKVVSSNQSEVYKLIK